MYEVKFVFRGKKHSYKAFLDTGCNLKHKGLPVVVINKRYCFDIYSDEYIMIHSGTGANVEKVYYLSEFFINKEKINCYCIFLEIDYDVIIGSNVF